MKVHELITKLQQYDPNKEIVATWECPIKDIDVCEICNEPAKGISFGKPRCHEHWNSSV